MMRFFLDNGASVSYFERCRKLRISPHHIHRTKAEQKHAIFTLAWCMSRMLADYGEMVPSDVPIKLEGIAQRCKDEIF